MQEFKSNGVNMIHLKGKQFYYLILLLIVYSNHAFPQEYGSPLWYAVRSQYVTLDRKYLLKYDTDHFLESKDPYTWKFNAYRDGKDFWFVNDCNSCKSIPDDYYAPMSIYHFDSIGNKLSKVIKIVHPGGMSFPSNLYPYNSKLIIIDSRAFYPEPEPSVGLHVIDPQKRCEDTFLVVRKFSYPKSVNLKDSLLYVIVQPCRQKFRLIWLLHYILPLKNGYKYDEIPEGNQILYIYDKDLRLKEIREIPLKDDPDIFEYNY